jgi:chemotaxis protein MotA
MSLIIGMVVVIACVITGYLMEHGNLALLWHPSEIVIICGAAIGAFIISSPPTVISLTVNSLGNIIKAKERKKEAYLEVLTLLSTVFAKIRKEGLIAVESDIEDPDNSPIFSAYPSVLTDHHALSYICDNLKVIISTSVTPFELDNIMELELDTHHHEAMIPSHAIAAIADGLPGLGIVAAVLGIVLTMGKISEPPEVLGASVGAALVGTFLGVLLCYGFVGPVAKNLENSANGDLIYYQVIKTGLVSFVGGAAPQIAVEFARRVIPSNEKPGFNELEEVIRKSKSK